MKSNGFDGINLPSSGHCFPRGWPGARSVDSLCVPVAVSLSQGEWTCMGVKSDGSYGVDSALFYSFPVVVQSPAAGDAPRRPRIVAGLQLDTDTTTHIAQTTRRLGAELDQALAIDDQMPPLVFDDVTSGESGSATHPGTA